MVYKNLYINVIIRTLFITLTSLLLGILYFKVNDWLITINLLGLIIIQVILMIRSLNKTNERINDFFVSLENDDTSFSFQLKNKEKSFKNLMQTLERLSHKMQHLRIDNEKQSHFFKYVVDNLSIGIIGIDSDQKIELLNKATNDLLGLKRIEKWEDLSHVSVEFFQKINKLQPNKQLLLKLNKGGYFLPLSITLHEYLYFDKILKIYTFQDVKKELDENELESWQQLIRVLTHEVMNSIGPVTSSIDTISELLYQENNKFELKSLEELSENVLSDILKGIQIIKERSIGLKEFVTNFRSLTLIPKLNIEYVFVSSVFKNVCYLFETELNKKKIHINFELYPESIKLEADIKLLEQVFINLIKNSIEAFESQDSNEIIFKSYVNVSNHVVIEINDNGKGMSSEIAEQVFIPFYTTKENGSGIGLSFVKQIMSLHGGQVLLKSELNIGTSILLVF